MNGTFSIDIQNFNGPFFYILCKYFWFLISMGHFQMECDKWRMAPGPLIPITGYKYIKRCITLMISTGMICLLVWLQKLEDTHWSYPKRGVTLLNGCIHFHFVLWISGIACHRKQFLQEQLTLLSHIWMIDWNVKKFNPT